MLTWTCWLRVTFHRGERRQNFMDLLWLQPRIIFSHLRFRVHLQRRCLRISARKNILIWNKVLDSMPQTLFRFTRKAMLQVLPTNSNLAKWTHTIDSMCSLFGALNQTYKHVLSNCSAALDHYRTCHNNILVSLANWLAGVKSSCSTLCVDGSTTFRSIDTVFQSTIRPDLVLFDESKVAVLELTICHESNLLKFRSYKLNKYSDFKLYFNPEFNNHKIELFSIQISVLVFFKYHWFLSFYKNPGFAESHQKSNYKFSNN